jgi:catechol 2,3-dioxygenase-like lactoylglutathione lyase family enzyme
MTSSPKSLDHVALWVADRDVLAGLLCDHLGMHVIERTESFTLVGADAREGKVTLFAADGPRDPGVLERIVLRVRDLDAALERLPASLAVERGDDGVAGFPGPEGVGLGLVAGAPDGLDYDLDHLVLRVSDPDRSSSRLEDFGFRREGGRLCVDDRHLRLVPGDPATSTRPLLNHVALLVDSADAQLEEVRRRGIGIDEIKDAPNTYAGFVTGPDGIRIEYVEHKPTFSLT